MKNGVTHQKTVFTSPREEVARSESITHARRPAPRPFDLDGLDAEEVTHFIRVVAGHGDLAGITLTSDGGAIVFSIVQGGVKHKAYASSPEQALFIIHDLLDEVY